MTLPGKNILILGAVCLSIIGGVGAYKIAQAARANLETSQKGIIASTNSNQNASASNSTSKLLGALQQAELATISSSSTNPFAPVAGDTLTNQLSKNFFTSYIQVQAGTESESQNEALINNALANIDVKQLPKEKYTASDLKVTGINTPAFLKTYANLFAQIQAEEIKKIQDNPSYYQDNLLEIGKIYAVIGERLIKMEVPVTVAAEHLVIANGYILSGENFKMIMEQDKDPLKSLIGLRQYKETVEQQHEMFTQIGTYLGTSGILFNKTEPGFFWTAFGAATSSGQ